MAEATILTIDELIAATERLVRLELLSDALGQDRVVRARKIGRAEYFALLPPPPPGSEHWPVTEAETREREWLQSLPAADLQARREALRDVVYRVVALAALEPQLTVDQARRLGDDAAVVATAILRFSGILPPAPPVESPTPEAQVPAEA